MIELPRSTYSGLTVILDKPSRFDTTELLSGYSGAWFNDQLLADPKYLIHRGNIEVRTLGETRPLLSGTKSILLLGQDSLDHYRTGLTLNEQRGSPFVENGVTCIASYTPQDAFDRKNYFSDEQETDSDDSDEDKSTHGKTRRANWKFWLRQDIRKTVRLCREGLRVPECNYHFYPDASEVINLLTTTKGKDFYFDVETDSCLQLTCFGFSFGDGEVYVVPMLQTHFRPKRYFYDEITTCKILRALSIALCNNTVVIHNSMFDLFVLVWRYGLPIGRQVFDTMLAHNRLFIEVEKSLGHCISLYTDLPYHKNEGVFEPIDRNQADALYSYNGKDVFAMTQVKPAILERARALGATESIDLANRMVVPYLTAMLQGMNIDKQRIQNIVTKNDRKQFQINRILAILTGKPEFNSNSPKQVSAYLYDEIGLKKPDKDFTNEKTLLSHQLRWEVPAISCILEYRKLTKQSSKVQFNPWRGLYALSRYNSDGSLTSGYEGNERFTCSYNLAGTTTMRLSSRILLKRYGAWGDNSQNWEKALRKCITPD